MFENMFENALKLDKRSTIVYFLELRQSSGLLVFLSFKTILGPMSVELIFQTYYAPNVANLGFLRIVPRIAFKKPKIAF